MGPSGPVSAGSVTDTPPTVAGGLARPEGQATQHHIAPPTEEEAATATMTIPPTTTDSATMTIPPTTTDMGTTGHAFVEIGCTTILSTRLKSAGWFDMIGGAEFMLENATTYDRIKHAIKGQYVTWLHLYLDNGDTVKKATQLARAQDRARGPWLIEACGTWAASSLQLRALSELVGVQVASTETRYHLANLASALAPSSGLPTGTGSWLSVEAEGLAELCTCLHARPRHRLPPQEWVISRDVERATAAALQAKRARAQADANAVGGLRNPAHSISNDVKAHSTGDKVRSILMTCLEGIDCRALLNTLGQQDTPTALTKLAERARHHLEKAFGIDRSSTPGIQAALMKALVESAGDIDTEAVAWLSDSAPLGIDRPIVPKGVFPLAEPTAAASALDETELVTGYTNYSSYDEYRAEADANLREELVRGRILWRRTKAELHRMRGAVVYNKIGVVAKVKHQLLKIRLIHDLRRSGVNAKVTMHERIILPRLMDVVRDLLALQQEHGLGWDVFIADFKDAFKQLRVAPIEQRHLGGAALDGYFVYMVMLFGVRSGPLIWGRVAAQLMRLTAAVLRPLPARLQCYVDDPLLSLAGPESQRPRIAIATVLFWLALGFELSWNKGQYGRGVEWIGAWLQDWLTASGAPGLLVTLPTEKLDKLKLMIDEMLQGPIIRKAVLRPFTGLVSWMASLLPQLGAFCRMLWAALYLYPGESWVYTKQVATALNWLRAFCHMQASPLQRRCRTPAQYYTCLTFDGSPWGGGATLQCGVSTLEARHQHPIATYWRRTWTPSDELRIKGKIGEAASQARWEAYALLKAVHAWLPLLRVSEGRVVVCGDAAGVLYDAVKFKAKDTTINMIMAELALLVAPLGLEIETMHIWSEWNHVADYLSRPAVAAQDPPPELQGVPSTSDPDLVFQLLDR